MENSLSFLTRDEIHGGNPGFSLHSINVKFITTFCHGDHE